MNYDPAPGCWLDIVVTIFAAILLVIGALFLVGLMLQDAVLWLLTKLT